MAIDFIFKTEGLGDGIPKRVFGEMVAKTNAAVAQRWHEKMRPRHFTWEGASKYGYAERVGKREGGIPRKRGAGILKGSSKPPLVQSGRSKDRSAIFNLRANARGFRLTMQTNALNFRPAGIVMSDELRTVTPDEQQELAQLFEGHLTKQLNAYRATRTERISA